jgi:hypothetical protein
MYFCMTPMWNTDLLESVGENFDVSLVMKEFSGVKQFTIWWVTLEQQDSLTDKKLKHKCQVVTQEKLDDIGSRLERTPRKSLKCLAQETGVLKASASKASQLLKFSPYKTTVIHTLQPCNLASRVHFCSWFLQSAVEGEIDLQLTFFSDEM